MEKASVQRLFRTDDDWFIHEQFTAANVIYTCICFSSEKGGTTVDCTFYGITSIIGIYRALLKLTQPEENRAAAYTLRMAYNNTRNTV